MHPCTHPEEPHGEYTYDDNDICNTVTEKEKNETFKSQQEKIRIRTVITNVHLLDCKVQRNRKAIFGRMVARNMTNTETYATLSLLNAPMDKDTRDPAIRTAAMAA